MRSGLVCRSWDRWIFYGTVHSLLRVVATRANVVLSESFREVILAYTLAIGPLDGTSRGS